MACWLWTPHVQQVASRYSDSNASHKSVCYSVFPQNQNHSLCVVRNRSTGHRGMKIYCNSTNDTNNNNQTETRGIQLYRDIERLLTETAKQSQASWGSSGDWCEVEGAWVLRPRNLKPISVVHFVGGIFVGAAPQLTYRFFLERLAEKGLLVIATPYASGFDHFFIADEVQFKYDRCIRSLRETVQDLPVFGIGHSLGSVIHLLIGSRYAVERNGNVLMAFNNKVSDSPKTPNLKFL